MAAGTYLWFSNHSLNLLCNTFLYFIFINISYCNVTYLLGAYVLHSTMSKCQLYSLVCAKEIKFVVPVDSGEILDDVVKSVRPLWVLELRMHCGYSSGRLLRLLPHGGRLITVVLDPVTADLGEEIILVAGFKQSQVQ